MRAILGFYGGVGNVTGANFLLDVGEGAFLVDCGLIQGDRFAADANADPFLYNPKDIDVLFVTHAHSDHIGRIPKLVKDGFAGVIYSTPPTKDLAAIMFADAYSIMRYEEERYGTKRIYDEGDINAALSLWETLDFGEPVDLPGSVHAWYTDAGHILGSGMVHFKRGEREIVFTGDIGNVPQPLMNPVVIPKGYDYMVMESVYGDRQHEEVDERTELLQYYIEDTRKKDGTLIIPAFSMERTQAMLFEINNLVERGIIESMPVFLDSPLAIKVTELYRKYTSYLKDEIQRQIQQGDDIFSFAGLSFTPTLEESQHIAAVPGPKIIIAGSGMSHGGRILAHEKRYLEDKTTTLLLVGYQSVGSLGRLLHDGAKRVTIDGEDIRVRARIARIRGYSGHADRDQLIGLVAEGGEKVRKVFVTMGEERAALFLVQRLHDYLGVDAVAPALRDEVEIDF